MVNSHTWLSALNDPHSLDFWDCCRLHPVEGLVLRRKAGTGLKVMTLKQCHFTRRDTIPGFEGRFQIHLIGLIKISFRHSSTATMTDTYKIKPTELN